MQQDKVQQKKGKDTVDSPTDPSQNELNHKSPKDLFSCKDPQGNNIDNKLKESTKNHSKEIIVIQNPNTIIYPHTMMIKTFHTSINKY